MHIADGNVGKYSVASISAWAMKIHGFSPISLIDGPRTGVGAHITPLIAEAGRLTLYNETDDDESISQCRHHTTARRSTAFGWQGVFIRTYIEYGMRGELAAWYDADYWSGTLAFH